MRVNASVERTGIGRPIQALVSFWASFSLPLRAIHAERKPLTIWKPGIMRNVHLVGIIALFACSAEASAQQPEAKAARARDLGVPFNGTPGPFNPIGDVPGVLVGHTTLVSGEGAHAVRTGVTAIVLRATLGYYPAATCVLNGDADFSGTIFAVEFGMLRSPIMPTGTASNGTVYPSVIKWSARKFPNWPLYMPVVADTWDPDLSDYLVFPLREEHVFAALDSAKSGPVAEGDVYSPVS